MILNEPHTAYPFEWDGVTRSGIIGDRQSDVHVITIGWCMWLGAHADPFVEATRGSSTNSLNCRAIEPPIFYYKSQI